VEPPFSAPATPAVEQTLGAQAVSVRWAFLGGLTVSVLGWGAALAPSTEVRSLARDLLPLIAVVHSLAIVALWLSARMFRLRFKSPKWLLVYWLFINLGLIAVFAPAASWLPDHKYNWEGKVLVTVVLGVFARVLFAERPSDMGASMRLAHPRSGWRSIAPLSLGAIVFVCVGTFAFGSEKFTSEAWFFEATLPGLSEELARGIGLALMAAAFTGRLSVRALSTRKLVWAAVCADSIFFGLAHAISADGGHIRLTPANLLTAIAGATFAVITIRTQSIWPSVILHNLTNLELFSPTLAVVNLGVFVWALAYRLRKGPFDYGESMARTALATSRGQAMSG
jgi:Type II CAAX prenyl endopeptidase Rce1-like